MRTLSDRQSREVEFYRSFSRLNSKTLDITFDPVIGQERRPWNPYWFVYETVRDLYSKDNRLLDVGCGTGVASVRFAKIGYHVSGFDISPENVDIATKRGLHYDLQNQVEFSTQTAENLNYPDEYFDIVVGIDILHHIEIAKAIRECHRVLKPGGAAVFKEHLVVPAFDRIRNSRPVKWLVPNEMSFENHITQDERKLSRRDIETVLVVFGSARIVRFELFSRINRFVRKPNDPKFSSLEKLDYFLFRTIPFLSRWGGNAVFVLRKMANAF